MVEHVHRDECYLNNVLICGEKAHTHGENCYLLRLEDNDINRILSEIEADEEKSLEHVITNVVYKASYLELVNEGILPAPTPTPTPTPTPLIELLPEGSSLETLTATNASVAALNDSIEENNITPALYLNERLISPASEGGTVSNSENIVNLTQGQNSPTDLITYAANANGGISTLAVGDPTLPPLIRPIHFYFMLDGNVTYVSSGSLTDNNTRRYSYADTVAAYKQTNIVIDFDTSDINSTYRIRYNMDGDTNKPEDFDTDTRTNGNSNLTFGTGNDPRYAILTTRSGYYGNYTYTAVPFFTVTLDRSEVGGTNSVQYVQSGQNSTLTLDSAYNWYTENGTQVTSVNPASGGITDTTTLFARPKTITASFEDKDGNPASSDQSGKPIDGKFTVELPERSNSVWIVKGSDGSVFYAADGKTTVDITKNTTFVAVPAENIVTLVYPAGNETNKTIPYNGTFTFPTLDGGYVWVGNDGSVYSGGATSDPIRANITFTASDQVSASFEYKNTANNKTEFYTPGKEITLPTLTGNNVWVDELGNVYTGGTKVTLDTHKTFTEKGRIIITYNLNAPTSLSAGATGHTTPEQTPTIAGSVGTTETVTVLEGDTTITLGVIPRVLTTLSNQGGTDAKKQYKTMAFFSGWAFGSDVVLPNAVVSYETLDAIDTNGTVTVTGNWIQGNGNTANFFVDLRSNLTGSTNAEDYTPSIFTTYFSHEGYTPKGNGQADFGGTDVSKSAEYDATIRALEGLREGTGKEAVWLYRFPTDQQVFDYLKSYIGEDTPITVDGITVTPGELNTDVFAIRWYNVNYWSTSGWHINASLVRKEGNIVVHKTFEGRTDYITAAQNGFTITAQSGTIDTNGNFTDNAGEADITLVASREASASDTTTIGYTAKTDPVVSDSGMMRVEYTWIIPKVGAGEHWHIEENIVEVEGTIGVGEWVIVDSSNSQSDEGDGTKTIVEGVTFPKDISSDEWLRAEFTNVYYSENSIMLRKIDALTRNRLNGAEFQIWQRTASGDQLMTFDLIEDEFEGETYKTYVYNPSGGTESVVKSDGTEISISIEHFTYDVGSLVIREVTTPAGYAPAVGEIVIGYKTVDGNKTIDILNTVDFATFDKGMLTIENTPQKMNVTAQKKWSNCFVDEWTDTVTFQLMAWDETTGKFSANLAASVLPEGTSTIQTLTIVKDEDADNSYTWADLPEYINGKKAIWTIKELAIGDEQIKADGTFPNWNSYVSLPTERIEGGVKTATITATNNPKAGTELRIMKIDNFNKPVSGATFEIWQGTKLLNTITTDATGEIIFHNLKYAIEYTVVETNIPVAYWGYDDPIKVTVNENATVTISADSPPNVRNSSQNYTIEVINYTGEPLPETGGMGTHIYTAGGLLLMAAAVALLIYRRKRRKEADLLDV